MGDWLRVLTAGQKHMDAARPQKASDLYRNGLETFANDPAAIAWLTFNLMLSESALYGFKVAQTYLMTVVNSDISWNAKLYTLERALTAADSADVNLEALYGDAVFTIEQYCAADHRAEDININSCLTVARNLSRLYPASQIDPRFLPTEEAERFPVSYAKAANPSPPEALDQANRPPRILVNSFKHYAPPQQSLGFRHVGAAFLLRLGSNTVLFDGNGIALDIPYGAYPAFLKTILQKAFKKFISHKIVGGVSFFIGDYFSQTLNYCHWLLDGMTRVIGARTAGLAFDHVIGAWKETAPFQTDSLKQILSAGQSYLGFEAEDGLIAIDDLYYADNASLEHINHPAFDCDKDLLQALRDTLMDGAPREKTRRLFVPRRYNRVVLNEQALLALLGEYGFESIDTDHMTLAAQIEAFSAAEAVVAPHGAALTNLLFASAGCKVLELFPPFGGSMCFYRLSSANHLDYTCYIDDISQGPNRDSDEGIISNVAGVEVDLAVVKDWLMKKFA